MHATSLRRSLLRIAALCAILTLDSGCGLVYRASRSGESWVIYSDRTGPFLDQVEKTVEEVYTAYGTLFEIEPSKLGRTKICLDGRKEDIVDHSSTPDLLGYYLPWFNLIRVDLEAAEARDPSALRTVLFHEIAHHFLNVRYAGIATRCWLNEGLASALECTAVAESRIDYPLFNPILAQIAQRHLLVDESPLSIADLVTFDWSGFHDSERKVDHYALAWSLVYYILEERLSPRTPLRERLDAIASLSEDELISLEADWRRYVTGLDVTGHLIRMAESRSPERRVRALWAIDRLGSLSSVRGRRVLRALGHLVESEDREIAAAAERALLDVVVRSPGSGSDRKTRNLVDRALERIRRSIEQDERDSATRVAIIDRLSMWTPDSSRWLGTLVRLLEADSAEVRAASARALARLAPKPTVTNPRFWMLAPADLREREVHEWREWVATQSSDALAQRTERS